MIEDKQNSTPIINNILLLSKYKSKMAACIVCNTKTTSSDVQDVSDVAKLRDRLQKVLDEAVPEEAVMCSSCQFDLAQIEMYYALLTVFKKRYSETAKQRLQSLEGEAGRNILHETAGFSGESFQDMLGGESSTTQTVSDSDAGDGLPDNPTAVGDLDISDVRTVKQEVAVEEPQTGTTETVSETVQPIAFPIWSPATKKRGGPRKNKTTDSGPSPGRPRKASPSGKKQRKPRSLNASDVKVVKKRGRPKKRAEPVTSSESEKTDLVQVKTEVEDETSDPTTHEDNPKNEEESEGKTTDEDTPTFVRRKVGRPKKTERMPKPPFTCPECKKVFVDRPRLRMHMRCHKEERPFVCNLCGKAFKDNSNLGGHMKTHTAEKKFKCLVCGKAFLRRIALDRHSLVHSNERPVQCEQCEARFKSQEELRKHIKFKHVQGRKFLCNICGMGLYTASNLRTHMISHSDVKPFGCDTCGKRFTSKQTLTNHEYSHKPEEAREKYLCPMCGREFMDKYYLNRHVKTHTGESKHSCSICNRYFIKLSDYRGHMRTHTGERPFRCSECGKAFRQPGHLKIHMMSHTDERPWKCGCGQGFRQKAKLQKHMRSKAHTAPQVKPASEEAAIVPSMPTVAPPAAPQTAPFMMEPMGLLAPMAMSWEETGTVFQGHQ